MEYKVTVPIVGYTEISFRSALILDDEEVFERAVEEWHEMERDDQVYALCWAFVEQVTAPVAVNEIEVESREWCGCFVYDVVVPIVGQASLTFDRQDVLIDDAFGLFDITFDCLDPDEQFDCLEWGFVPAVFDGDVCHAPLREMKVSHEV